MGVTTSIFSDFGPKQLESNGQNTPPTCEAVSAAEVLPVSNIVKAISMPSGEALQVLRMDVCPSQVLVLTLASDHGLQDGEDGDMITLDDMRGTLSGFNGRRELGIRQHSEILGALK
eukprot:Skav228905  [mRNA]  locus=scaffold118:97128:98299:+ [translate_table: standard]